MWWSAYGGCVTNNNNICFGVNCFLFIHGLSKMPFSMKVNHRGNLVCDLVLKYVGGEKNIVA